MMSWINVNTCSLQHHFLFIHIKNEASLTVLDLKLIVLILQKTSALVIQYKIFPINLLEKQYEEVGWDIWDTRYTLSYRWICLRCLYYMPLVYQNRLKLQFTPTLRVQVKQLITYKEWFSLLLTCNRKSNVRLFLYFWPLI